ncbi:hypothetical protein [Actinomyces ruminis]|uniref:hypothetical protein n=1 Tax=Actinomyces ruminis TaxID=1937003 RepID=UPI0011774361|nr:hypothetical protein [Actinomyces ruminis]
MASSSVAEWGNRTIVKTNSREAVYADTGEIIDLGGSNSGLLADGWFYYEDGIYTIMSTDREVVATFDGDLPSNQAVRPLSPVSQWSGDQLRSVIVDHNASWADTWIETIDGETHREAGSFTLHNGTTAWTGAEGSRYIGALGIEGESGALSTNEELFIYYSAGSNNKAPDIYDIFPIDGSEVLINQAVLPDARGYLASPDLLVTWSDNGQWELVAYTPLSN